MRPSNWPQRNINSFNLVTQKCPNVFRTPVRMFPEYAARPDDKLMVSVYNETDNVSLA